MKDKGEGGITHIRCSCGQVNKLSSSNFCTRCRTAFFEQLGKPTDSIMQYRFKNAMVLKGSIVNEFDKGTRRGIWIRQRYGIWLATDIRHNLISFSTIFTKPLVLVTLWLLIPASVTLVLLLYHHHSTVLMNPARAVGIPKDSVICIPIGSEDEAEMPGIMETLKQPIPSGHIENYIFLGISEYLIICLGLFLTWLWIKKGK